jgi:hypothetical protein
VRPAARASSSSASLSAGSRWRSAGRGRRWRAAGVELDAVGVGGDPVGDLRVLGANPQDRPRGPPRSRCSCWPAEVATTTSSRSALLRPSEDSHQRVVVVQEGPELGGRRAAPGTRWARSRTSRPHPDPFPQVLGHVLEVDVPEPADRQLCWPSIAVDGSRPSGEHVHYVRDRGLSAPGLSAWCPRAHPGCGAPDAADRLHDSRATRSPSSTAARPTYPSCVTAWSTTPLARLRAGDPSTRVRWTLYRPSAGRRVGPWHGEDPLTLLEQVRD